MFARSVLPFALLLACGSSDSDSDSSSGSSSEGVAGTVASSQLEARSAVAWYGTIATELQGGIPREIAGLQIWISDQELGCGTLSIEPSVLLDVAVYGETVEPGTYSIVSSVNPPSEGEAIVNYNELGADCGSRVSSGSVRGTLELSSIGTRVSGSLSVTFPDGSVSGELDAELCPEAPEVSFCP